MAPTAETKMELITPEVDGRVEETSMDASLELTVDAKLKQVEDELASAREAEDDATAPADGLDGLSYSKRVQKLDSLLEKAGAYSKFLLANMDAPLPETTPKKDSKKRRKTEKQGATKLQKINEASAAHTVAEMNFKQPSLLTGGTLRSYQLEGIQWMCNLFENGLNGILADEMGLGKTVQVIGMVAQLKAKGVTGPFLVVSPLSTLANWENEFKRFTPSIPCLVYHGNGAERLEMRKKVLGGRGKQANSDFPVIITSYEVIIRDASAFTALGYVWKYIIIDEGHRLKNMNCLLMRELKKCKSENRLLLSGTPLQNNLSELWSLLNFLLPDVFDDLALFESWFSSGDATGTNDIISKKDVLNNHKKSQVVSKLHEILRPFVLRRLKHDVVADVPSKTELVVYCAMTELQEHYYRLIADRKLQGELEKSVRAGSAKNLAMQLRKCCNHPFLFDEETDANGELVTDESLVETSGKMMVLDKMLHRLLDAKHKVLIFSQMTKVLDILEDFMTLRSYEYCRLDGQTHFRDRQSAMDAFNDPNGGLQIFLLSTRAGGLGINLTGADTVILYDSDWNPHQDSQAQDRCHRIGQTKDVAVYRLIVENSFENRMLERANAKRTLERVVLSRGEFSSQKKNTSKETHLSLDELEALLKDDIAIRKEATGGITDAELDLICNRDVVVDAFIKRTKSDVASSSTGYYVVENANVASMESFT
ncbi:hypothetical protein SPRG_02846 [Saprolegnia parasitica CBS 223.65]|uniref:Uncharacterized protein n=1 Tax=Saprolegnia parasitica (strain CBS 223.65) TaxID=695850 RepID=A0A067CNU2_SAPPC|nr:hypothetical protein SPRG_02846 [Saprolegnia parasitica CBS 223.65]KDO32369.1 hypothetical protein SPRG_02846 [Saprolegnia parasitica CBS 223.65]|eukprot:XP_012196823.1 hypothetical protein SPRG_02846 [Saprolegnia parasitica CBS 223.65]